MSSGGALTSGEAAVTNLLENPRSVLWTKLLLGLPDPDALQPLKSTDTKALLGPVTIAGAEHTELK